MDPARPRSDVCPGIQGVTPFWEEDAVDTQIATSE